MEERESVPGWLIVAIVAALAAGVIGLATRNSKTKRQYNQLVSAIQDLVEEGRDKAENAAEVLGDAGQDLAKDVQRRARKAKRRLG